MSNKKRGQGVILTDYEKRNAGVPGGGEWFKKKECAKASASAMYGVGLGFVGAWAYAGKGYCYGVYGSYDDFLSCILKLKAGRRYGFEMIRTENGCNLYFDIEGIIEDPKDEEGTCGRIIEGIRRDLWEKYGKEFGLQITRGSRFIDGKGFKLSMHIVVTGLVFSNNCGGAMKNCVSRIRERLDEADRHFIDLKPYIKDGLMRMVLNSKRGSVVPLRNVTGDPFSRSDSLFSRKVYEDSDVGARGNCSITQHMNNLFTSTYVDGNAVAGNGIASAGRKSTSSRREKTVGEKQSKTSGGRMDGIFPAEIVAVLQEAMEQENSKGCIVGGNYVCENGRFFVYCKNSGIRHCIANDSGHKCENENAYLCFEGGYVVYRCRSQGCLGTSHILCAYPAILKKFFADLAKPVGLGCIGQKRDRVDDSDETVAHEVDGEAVSNWLHEEEMCGGDNMETEEEDTARYWNLPQYDKPHFPFPELDKYQQDRAKYMDRRFLDKEMYNDGVRVHVVESSCCTGKTTSAFDYACDNNLKILALATRISQLNAHEEVIAGNMDTSKRYDSTSLKGSKTGEHHLLSTLDSVSRIVSFLERNPELAKGYILFLDEFHSIVQYLYSSQTLAQKRRSVLQDIQWLIRHAQKVIVADNTLSNHDFYFLESALNEHGQHVELTFHINKYQTFKDVPAVHVSDREKLFQKMLVHFHAGTPFVTACNTKADAKYFKQRLWDETTDATLRARIRIYTGDTKSSINIAHEVKFWYISFVIYSPKISTGIDYHPDTPIDVFYVGRGENTVCPATAVQMVTRTRRIKTLYICLDRMRTKPKYQSEAEMNENLDRLQKSYHSDTPGCHKMTDFFALCELSERTWCPLKLEDVYSENKFSKGYRAWLWHEEVMKASWVFNFNTYLRKRGFIVIEEEAGARIRLQDREVRRNVMKKCNQDAMKEFLLWKDGKYTPDGELFEMRLACVREFNKNTNVEGLSKQLLDSKNHLITVLKSFQTYYRRFERGRIEGIFLSTAITSHNQNMLFGMYTRDKLLEIKKYDQTVEYDLQNAHTVCISVLLLRDLIAVFNVGLPDGVDIKPYDMTLSQTQYDEDDEVEVPDHVWQLFVYKCRSVKEQPTTRRGLIRAICTLSRRIFGKFSITKNATTRTVPCKKVGFKKIKCYDYVGNDIYFRVHVLLADWSKRELVDIEPEIVARYDLEKRRECAVQLCPDALGIRQQQKNDMDRQGKKEQQKLIAQAERDKSSLLKKQRFDSCMNRSPKRHKTMDAL